MQTRRQYENNSPFLFLVVDAITTTQRRGPSSTGCLPELRIQRSEALLTCAKIRMK